MTGWRSSGGSVTLAAECAFEPGLKAAAARRNWAAAARRNWAAAARRHWAAAAHRN